jgi:hypothetical protein
MFLDIDDFIVHPNKYIKSKGSMRPKHFIFDLDETLGDFADLHTLWSSINEIVPSTQPDFNKILDIFPEFLRYGIITILEFLHHKKKEGKCGKIYIYTNNQCPPPWVEYIANYIESKKNMTGLFERPICAFKIKNSVLEKDRTTHDKTLRDFIKCSRLPRSAELCFIDNAYHHKMVGGSIFYIQPRSYYHSLSVQEIIDRFLRSGIVMLKSVDWRLHLQNYFAMNYGDAEIKTREDEDTDIAVSRKLMYTIKEFFYLALKKEKTKRRSILLPNKTHKRKY